MKANISFSINVPEGFTPGHCANCPLASKSYYENHYVEESVSCKLGFTSITCPVSVAAETAPHDGDPCKQHGYWKHTLKSTFPQYQPDEYTCSICGSIGGRLLKYCPACGATMEGVVE